MFHRGRREVGLLSDERAQAAHIERVEDLAQLDVALEARPSGESVFAGNGELRASQRRWCRHDREASNCGAIAVLQVAEQVLRKAPDLLEAQTRREGGHGDESSCSRLPR